MHQIAFEPAFAAKARNAPWDLRVSARYDFAIGHPDRDHFPAAELAEASRRVLEREGGRFALYPNEEIHRPTRELVARKYALEEGLDIPIEEIAITNGSLQGLTMIAESFIDPGDTVVVEEFT
jgi:2-aminoadipate transaminase